MDEEGQPSTIEYFGRVQAIIQLHFTSFEVTLLKGKWYGSKSPFRIRPNLLLDECGFLRVRTSTHLPSHLATHEPFAMPEDCDQVFFIEDRLNRGSSLVIKHDPRSNPVVYKGALGQARYTPINDERVTPIGGYSYRSPPRTWGPSKFWNEQGIRP